MEKSRKGITLLEIMAALLILAMAFLPLIGVIGSGTKDTDSFNSFAFAQTTARNILDTLLDDVPFDSIREATAAVTDTDGSNPDNHVGELFNLTTPSYDCTSFLQLLGNTSGADNYARGELVDERGTRYQVKLFIFPVSSSNPHNSNTDLTFTYKPRPLYENQQNAAGQNIWYTDKGKGYNPLYVRNQADLPYESSITQPADKELGARDLGVKDGVPGNNACVMKRFLLKIKWNNQNHARSIEVYTAKAALN